MARITKRGYWVPTTSNLALDALNRLEESAVELLGRPISEKRSNWAREKIERSKYAQDNNLPLPNRDTPGEVVLGLALEMILHKKPYELQQQVRIDQLPPVDYVLGAQRWPGQVVIECDGAQHKNRKEYDDKRNADLEELGYTVMRFPNNRIYREPLECAEEAANPIPWDLL